MVCESCTMRGHTDLHLLNEATEARAPEVGCPAGPAAPLEHPTPVSWSHILSGARLEFPLAPSHPGCALNDSPVGLAAYILEKFSTWTKSEYRELEDGGLER